MRTKVFRHLNWNEHPVQWKLQSNAVWLRSARTLSRCPPFSKEDSSEKGAEWRLPVTSLVTFIFNV